MCLVAGKEKLKMKFSGGNVSDANVHRDVDDFASSIRNIY